MSNAAEVGAFDPGSAQFSKCHFGSPQGRQFCPSLRRISKYLTMDDTFTGSTHALAIDVTWFGYTDSWLSLIQGRTQASIPGK